MPVSQNGWSANDRSLIQTYTIGDGRQIPLRKGDAGFLLVELANWFDEFIEDVDQGILDDWGYAERPIRDGVELSNHASGTAEDLNATRHPLGARGTFPRAKAAAIRKHLLVKFEGVIRWGGDYVNRADEMHFEIVGTPGEVARVAAKIRAANRVAVESPTLLDILTAVQRFADNSKSLPAKGLYLSARAVLGPVYSGSTKTVRVPGTVAGVIGLLEAKRELVTSVATKARFTAAINLLKPVR